MFLNVQLAMYNLDGFLTQVVKDQREAAMKRKENSPETEESNVTQKNEDASIPQKETSKRGWAAKKAAFNQKQEGDDNGSANTSTDAVKDVKEKKQKESSVLLGGVSFLVGDIDHADFLVCQWHMTWRMIPVVRYRRETR